MGFHTFDPAEADRLEDVSRYRFCSREELLGALGVDTDGHLIDLGSGTGFYTRELAPFFDRVSAVDIQPAMHELFREKGVPDTVALVESSTAELPFADESADAAVSTMTAHELPLAETLADLYRVLRPGSPIAVVDWSAKGRGEAGPPVDERHPMATVTEAVTEAGFSVERCVERPETYFIEASR
jgi:ubiquinone/menaquinone biosynthesis C-methylase UbiE